MLTLPKIVLKGIRKTIPPGYVLGRVSPSTGEVQLISLTALANHLVATGVIASQAQVNTQDLVDSDGLVLDISNSPILVP